MKRTIIAVCLLSMVSGFALAEDFAPSVLMQPDVSQVPGRHIDIMGLAPGMSVEAARAVLTELQGSEPKQRLQQTRIHEGSVSVTSTPYVASLEALSGSEWLGVQFSGASSGNSIVLVQRDVRYQSVAEAPIFDQFINSLVEKYGTPTFQREGMEGSILMWTYKEGTSAPCDPSGNPQCLAPESAFNMLSEAAKHYDVVIYAAVVRALTDRNRVSKFKMSSTDLELKLAADQADVAGLQSALVQSVTASESNAESPHL
jgi:hypothetical protein